MSALLGGEPNEAAALADGFSPTAVLAERQNIMKAALRPCNRDFQLVLRCEKLLWSLQIRRNYLTMAKPSYSVLWSTVIQCSAVCAVIVPDDAVKISSPCKVSLGRLQRLRIRAAIT